MFAIVLILILISASACDTGVTINIILCPKDAKLGKSLNMTCEAIFDTSTVLITNIEWTIGWRTTLAADDLVREDGKALRTIKFPIITKEDARYYVCSVHYIKEGVVEPKRKDKDYPLQVLYPPPLPPECIASYNVTVKNGTCMETVHARCHLPDYGDPKSDGQIYKDGVAIQDQTIKDEPPHHRNWNTTFWMEEYQIQNITCKVVNPLWDYSRECIFRKFVRTSGCASRSTEVPVTHAPETQSVTSSRSTVLDDNQGSNPDSNKWKITASVFITITIIIIIALTIFLRFRKRSKSQKKDDAGETPDDESSPALQVNTQMSNT